MGRSTNLVQLRKLRMVIGKSTFRGQALGMLNFTAQVVDCRRTAALDLVVHSWRAQHIGGWCWFDEECKTPRDSVQYNARRPCQVQAHVTVITALISESQRQP
jgi:hypothetical protein